MFKLYSSISEHLAQDALANTNMDSTKAENAALKRENAQLRLQVLELEDVERKEEPEVNQVYMI